MRNFNSGVGRAKAPTSKTVNRVAPKQLVASSVVALPGASNLGTAAVHAAAAPSGALNSPAGKRVSERLSGGASASGGSTGGGGRQTNLQAQLGKSPACGAIGKKLESARADMDSCLNNWWWSKIVPKDLEALVRTFASLKEAFSKARAVDEIVDVTFYMESCQSLLEVSAHDL
jgi:hypothetical protein